MDCAVCLEPLQLRLELELQCGHSFHFTCIGKAAVLHEDEVPCPLCRSKQDVGELLKAGTLAACQRVKVGDLSAACDVLDIAVSCSRSNLQRVGCARRRLSTVLPGVMTRSGLKRWGRRSQVDPEELLIAARELDRIQKEESRFVRMSTCAFEAAGDAGAGPAQASRAGLAVLKAIQQMMRVHNL
jgi:hypothetical protein